MANIKISELSTATTFNNNDYTMLVQSGENKKITGSDFINAIIPDSGWQTATLSSSFSSFDNDSAPKYRKLGKIVEITGVVTPTAIITANTGANILQLPEGYRPSMPVRVVCQGAASNRWLLTVNTNGSVTFGRYGSSTLIDADAQIWLPLHVIFTID